MKRLPVIICIVVAFVAGVTGCDGMRRYDARLAAADSLMRSAPDSALAIVQAVDRDSLDRESDRAYHDLLLTQARYRCYVTAASDSDINRALAWYRAHSGEREKLTRALIYKGAVMEELGHPDSAMLYYKQAEANADPDDYFNLGYVNMRIAVLYQLFFTNDAAVLFRLRSAHPYFIATRDTSHLIFTIGTIGAYATDIDSSRQYLLEAINLANNINSPDGLQYQSKLAGTYFFEGEYQQALDLAMGIVRNEHRDLCNEHQFYYYAALSYIYLNHLDSAQWLFRQIPPPSNIVDSMNHFHLLAELAKADGHINDYSRYIELFNKIDVMLLETAKDSQLTKIESSFDSNQLRNEVEGRSNTRLLFVILLAAALLAAIAILAKIIISRRIIAYQRDLAMARAEIEKTIGDYEARIAENESSLAKQRALLDEKDKKFKKVAKENDKLLSQQIEINGRISRIVRKRLAAINEIYQDIRVKTANNSPYKRSVPLISLIKDWNEKKQIYMITPKESFWKELQVSIDEEYHGLASFVKNKYPSLAIREFHLFLLLSAKISPQIIKLCLDFTNPTTVSNYKRKLMKNLTGHDMKLEDFIQDYLDGKLN